jgi:hypothetical protein
MRTIGGPPEGGDHLDPRWVGAWYPRELWHFHSQLLARYRIVLAPGEFSMIKAALRSGKAQRVLTHRFRWERPLPGRMCSPASNLRFPEGSQRGKSDPLRTFGESAYGRRQ